MHELLEIHRFGLRLRTFALLLEVLREEVPGRLLDPLLVPGDLETGHVFKCPLALVQVQLVRLRATHL